MIAAFMIVLVILSGANETKKPSKARLRGFGGLQKEMRPLPPRRFNVSRIGSAYVHQVGRLSYAHESEGHASCGLLA